jgi:hypothetical protein
MDHILRLCVIVNKAALFTFLLDLLFNLQKSLKILNYYINP